MMNAHLSMDTVLLVAMMAAALWTVVGRSLLKAAIGLAVTSAILTILMFRLDSTLAAVFELSVCAGLMTVIFVSTISLTKPLTNAEINELSKERHKRFGYLPLVLILASIALTFIRIRNNIMTPPNAAAGASAQEVMWNMRPLDMFGQIIIIIIGALGVVILFEERKKDEW